MTTAKPSADVQRRLSRPRDGRVAAPVAIAHLGVGNFFRAHQAWYTDRAPDAAEWGIAAFTGRSAAVADTLAGQDGLYTLVVRGAVGDEPRVVSSLSAVHPGEDAESWLRVVSSPHVRVLTATITEAGYRRGSGGGLDMADPQVIADLGRLRSGQDPGSDPSGAGAASTAPGRLVAGLIARRRADAGPLTLMSCDNVAGNAAMARRIVLDLAELVDPGHADWIRAQVSFAGSMVDRITPRTTGEDRAQLARVTGIDDPACVITEPFSEWVVSGDFPGGRPDWEAAGAHFVADIEPWEHRKLWLLNGSHSLMAYAGPLLGATTVAEAIADPMMLGWVNQWWDDAQAALPLPEAEVADYRLALLERYRNPRIRHLLSQIAADGTQKLPIRILPALRHARRAGRMPLGATRAIAAWTLHLQGHGGQVTDTGAGVLRDELAGRSIGAAVDRVCHHLQVEDPEVAVAAVEQAQELLTRQGSRTGFPDRADS